MPQYQGAMTSLQSPPSRKLYLSGSYWGDLRFYFNFCTMSVLTHTRLLIHEGNYPF